MNRRNTEIVQSLLDALPKKYSDDYGTWFRIGCAIHSFDRGPDGLRLWRKFSERSASKAAATKFEDHWARFDRPYQGREITIATLRRYALDEGCQPLAWDMREPARRA